MIAGAAGHVVASNVFAPGTVAHINAFDGDGTGLPDQLWGGNNSALENVCPAEATPPPDYPVTNGNIIITQG